MQDLAQLRNIPLIDTIIALGLVADVSDKKQYKADGFRITLNNQKFYDHVAGLGGGGSIDLVGHVLACDFAAAIEFLDNGYSIKPEATKAQKNSVKTASIIPNEHSENWPKTRAYLIEQRRLNAGLIDWCFDMQLIYADRYSNAVFRYGAGIELRGIYKKFKGSRGKATKPFSIFYCAKQPTALAIVESAIDAISYRQTHKTHFVCAIGGNSNDYLMKYCINRAISKNIPIISAFDDDEGGEIAHKKLQNLALSDVCIIRHKPKNKDWNKSL